MRADNSNWLSDFYSGRTVLITGHTGFKGAWLSLWLTRLGARVCGLSLPEKGDPSRALFQPKIAGSLSLDLRDRDAVARALHQRRPEIVFHLAAQSLVGRSLEDPIGTLATNVMGTAHLIDAACRTSETRVLLNVTSDKCYRNVGSLGPFVETDPLGGLDPYSASKACSEILTTAWSMSLRVSGVPSMATARAGNVIGGGDNGANRILPDIVRAIAACRPVTLRNPSAMRPWQHVLDPLFGYLALARALHEDAPRFEGAWNFGPEPTERTEVRELARRVVLRWGKGNVVEASTPNPHEAQSLALDTTKAKKYLGWRPIIDLEHAIEMTVDWYRRVIDDHEDPVRVTEEQIAKFQVASPSAAQ